MAKGTTGQLNDMLDKAENRYALVHKVAKRAKKIMEGTAQTSEELSGNRAIVSAIKEVAAEEYPQ